MSNNEEKVSVYRELLAEISQYRRLTIPFQILWRKLHFIISLVIVVGMHIAVVFVANVAAWVSVIFLFLTTLVVVTGGINGLIWYMGVRAELRALQEVQMEVEDAYTYIRKKEV